jgi:DNA polymerase
VRQEEAAIDAEISELTGGRVTSINQVPKLGALLAELGHDVGGLTKKAVSALLAQGPEGDGKRLLELRQLGAQAASRKLASLLAGVDADQRLRGTFKYHGASTGRWSGARFQPQNLKKAKAENLDAAIDAIMAGDLERLRQIGAPLAIAGDVSRNMIVAAPDHVLIGADFSAVESRVLAWLAGETWKVDAYRQFDETGDPKLEPYSITASKILRRVVTPEDEAGRQIGKLCDLAFGFGGGASAWRRFDGSGNYTDEEIERFKLQWRNAHAATVRFWHGLENALRRALRSKEPIDFNSLSAEAVANTLYLTLPSGRRLAYPGARPVPGKHPGTVQIVFKDNGRGGWSDQRGWFGTFTENVVQAVARDLLASAMLRLEAVGYPIVLHVHDEAVAEVPEGFGSDEEFGAVMTALPDWATGLPLAAKAWMRTCYAKPANATSGSSTSSPPPPAQKAQLPVIIAPRQLPVIVASRRRERGEAHVRLGELIGQPLVNGKMCCPFHADDTPSLHIFDDHFFCFGCGARGDHVDWLMIVEGKNSRRGRARTQDVDGAEGATSPKRQRTHPRLCSTSLGKVAADRRHAGRPLPRRRAQRRRRHAAGRCSAAVSSALSLRPGHAPSLSDRALPRR